MTKRERPDRRQILESKLKRGGALARRAAAAAAIALALAPLAQAERENAWSTRAIRTWGQALTEAGFFGSPRWATAALPACGSANKGAIAYDLTTDEFKGCDGSAWGALGGGSGDVTAAANIADNALVRGDGGAKGIQQSQAGGVLLDDNDDLIFEGTADDFETTIAVADATADRAVTVPDATGTVLLNESGSVFAGDSGAGGTIGAVPAPAAGDAAAGKFLKADGTWAAGGGIGGSTGATDNAILRADGTGGATLQAGYSSNAPTISDAGRITALGGIVAAEGTGATNATLGLTFGTRDAGFHLRSNFQLAWVQNAGYMFTTRNFGSDRYLGLATGTVLLFTGDAEGDSDANSAGFSGFGSVNPSAICLIDSGAQLCNNATPSSNAKLTGESGLGTNIAGGNLTFAGGYGTGNATPGAIIFQTSTPGASGTTVQTQATRMTLDTDSLDFDSTIDVVFGAASGGKVTVTDASELITLSTGSATTNSSGNLAAASSIIDAIACRVTTTITTATDWGVKVTGGTAFNLIGTATTASTSLTAGNTVVWVPANHADQYNNAATTITITTTGTPGAGVIRCTVHTRSFTPPTS